MTMVLTHHPAHHHRLFRVFGENGYLTRLCCEDWSSKMCYPCVYRYRHDAVDAAHDVPMERGDKTGQVRETPRIRREYRAEKQAGVTPMTERKHLWNLRECPWCVRTFDRDPNAASNIAYAATEELRGHARPHPLSRRRDPAADDAAQGLDANAHGPAV